MTETPKQPQPPPLPRRRIEPLPPPPGAFDTVLHRAQARRHRRLSTVAAVAGVFLAGLWGGLAMAGGVSGVQDTFVSLADRGSSLVKANESSTSPTPSGKAVAPPTVRRSSSAPVIATGSPPAIGHTRTAMVRGRVVTGGGTPVVGMFVYTGTVSGQSFLPRAAPSAVTNDQGRYAVACTDSPVLLTPWTLNEPRGTAKGRWAATYVTSPTCSTTAASTVTTVKPAASVTGQVQTDNGCADADFTLSLWLNGNRPTSVRLGNLNAGDSFKISGLPRGHHVLGAQGRQTKVSLTAGARVTKNVTFSCPAQPTGSPTPTVPDVSPTPTDTPTPDPSPSPTPTATASAGA